MTKATLTEFSDLSVGRGGGVIQAGREPALAEQVIDFTSGAARSTVSHRNTRLAYLVADADAYFKVGGSTVVATTDQVCRPLVAGQSVAIGLQGDQYVSVIAA